MRIATALIASLLISAPALAQTSSDSQDHSAHHPGAAQESPAAAPSTSPQAPAQTGAAANPARPAAASMECPMMPGMMEAMMKGMMQGMMASGQPAAGQAAMPGMAGMGGMGGMASGGPQRQGGMATAGADQSLQAITLRALAERTAKSLAGTGQAGDVEFARVAVTLQEALLDAAKAAAAFGNSPETRQKAQSLVAANEAQLAALRSWAASLK